MPSTEPSTFINIMSFNLHNQSHGIGITDENVHVTGEKTKAIAAAAIQAPVF